MIQQHWCCMRPAGSTMNVGGERVEGVHLQIGSDICRRFKLGSYWETSFSPARPILGLSILLRSQEDTPVTEENHLILSNQDDGWVADCFSQVFSS